MDAEVHPRLREQYEPSLRPRAQHHPPSKDNDDSEGSVDSVDSGNLGQE